MRHALDGKGRYFYAVDYPLGAWVDHDGVTYRVTDVNGVVMFVAI